MTHCCEENAELIKEYDPQPKNKDGSVRWYLFRWDDGMDGSRRLMKCRQCSACYLVQAYHLHQFSAQKQILFEDWYLAENERQADYWNKIYTGIQLNHTLKPVFHKEIDR